MGAAQASRGTTCTAGYESFWSTHARTIMAWLKLHEGLRGANPGIAAPTLAWDDDLAHPLTRLTCQQRSPRCKKTQEAGTTQAEMRPRSSQTTSFASDHGYKRDMDWRHGHPPTTAGRASRGQEQVWQLRSMSPPSLGHPLERSRQRSLHLRCDCKASHGC